VVKKLDKCIEEKLANVIKNNFTLLVGDATGVDKLTQQFMHRNRYSNVTVYASQGKARNNLGNWEIENVTVGDNVKGFSFYSAKDLKMAEDADYGFMIWNGNSKGTLNNIINLTRLNKRVLVYLIPHKKFYVIETIEEAEKIAFACGGDAVTLFDKLNSKMYPARKESSIEQLSIFN